MNEQGYCKNRLALLAEISNVLIKEEDFNKVLRLVLSIMSEHMEMMRGMITLYDRESGNIMINESFGLSVNEKAKGNYKIGEGIIGQVVETGHPMVVPNIAKEPNFLDRTGARADLDTSTLCYLCVPIKWNREVLGTISADRFIKVPKSETGKLSKMDAKDINALMESDLSLLSIIAAMISQTIQLKQQTFKEQRHVAELNQNMEEFASHGSEAVDFDKPVNIIGNSKSMRSVFQMINKISPTNATVLILGESGVGKELVASDIHFKSQRKNKPFIKFNCAALPESIIESELFGHEKGAFTGAVSARKGRFEQADSGTIFLDEIGELSLGIQAKLLRILQEKEFERVGGNKTLKVDVRIISATNRDLEEEIQEGRFREDLYYRLNIFPITVPPLRERKADILLLSDYFVEKYNEMNGKGIRRISTTAIDMLMRYHWPGNVRELENSIERAVILSDDGVIHGYHLPPSLQTAESSGTPYSGPLDQRLDSLEYEMIVEALKNAKGNMSKAAQELGLTDRVMGLRVKKFGIDYKIYRTQR
jgi:Nif-specific regulatory protein